MLVSAEHDNLICRPESSRIARASSTQHARRNAFRDSSRPATAMSPHNKHRKHHGCAARTPIYRAVVPCDVCPGLVFSATQTISEKEHRDGRRVQSHTAQSVPFRAYGFLVHDQHGDAMSGRHVLWFSRADSSRHHASPTFALRRNALDSRFCLDAAAVP